MGRTALPLTPPYVVYLGPVGAPTPGQGDALELSPMRPDTVLMAVTPEAPPSQAACAISRTSVMLGVILAKKGMSGPAASRTHWQICVTTSGTCPHARPMPRSPMPWGQLRLSSRASGFAGRVSLTSSCQSSLLDTAMMEATTTRSGKSRLSSRTVSTQYCAVFSEMSSMFRNELWLGPYVCPLVVPRTMRGDTLVMRSRSRAYVLVTQNPQPCSKARRIILADVHGGAEARPNGLGKRMPAKSKDTSTWSTGVVMGGSTGVSPMSVWPSSDMRYLCMNHAAFLPSLAASTVMVLPAQSPPAKIHGAWRDW
mmetsp:Transcript_28543/g.67489  ORF Transcript_28543/g.67489 Transcript_28543/m.67489 type:complete len:311 (+) Transcript_28543:187-1119(+)